MRRIRCLTLGHCCWTIAATRTKATSRYLGQSKAFSAAGRAPFDQTLFACVVLGFRWLIELCRQFGNLFGDFPVKHAGVLRSQPCAYARINAVMSVNWRPMATNAKLPVGFRDGLRPWQ